MSTVANEQAATGIRGFLVKIYKPIYQWANSTFATKEDVTAIETSTVSNVSQQTAAAIWSNYTFATTDNDQAQQSEQSGESGNE